MTVQYISDNKGRPTAVQLQIPIEEWNRLKEKYPELEEESIVSESIPDWQEELVKLELERLAAGSTELSDWNDIKGSFKI